MSEQNFKINTDNYLAFEYEEYKEALQALALSQPSEYYKLRKNVLSSLKKGIIKQVFETYYNLLTSGTISGEDHFTTAGVPAPHYPNQKASEFALGASKTINHILDECLDIILPANHLAIAHGNLIKKAEGELVGK